MQTLSRNSAVLVELDVCRVVDAALVGIGHDGQEQARAAEYR
jgi:hypothetical protein